MKCNLDIGFRNYSMTEIMPVVSTAFQVPEEEICKGNVLVDSSQEVVVLNSPVAFESSHEEPSNITIRTKYPGN